MCQNPVREIGTIWKQKERFEGSYEKHCETDCYELTLLPKEGAWKVIPSKGLELSYDPEAKLFCMEFTDKELGCGRTIRGRELDEVTDARIIVDASCVEVFLNGGKDVFSTRFYPRRKLSGGSTWRTCNRRLPVLLGKPHRSIWGNRT